MTTISAGELQQGVKAAQDVLAAFSSRLTNVGADEAVLLDAAKLAAMIDPALAPLVVALPIAEAIIAWVIANNESARPGALNHIASGRKGSNPNDDSS